MKHHSYGNDQSKRFHGNSNKYQTVNSLNLQKLSSLNIKTWLAAREQARPGLGLRKNKKTGSSRK